MSKLRTTAEERARRRPDFRSDTITADLLADVDTLLADNARLCVIDTLLADSASLRAVNAALLAALQEAVSFENEDTGCLVAPIANMDEDANADVPCPDRRCHEHGCMVSRVNGWRAAIASAERTP